MPKEMEEEIEEKSEKKHSKKQKKSKVDDVQTETVEENTMDTTSESKQDKKSKKKRKHDEEFVGAVESHSNVEIVESNEDQEGKDSEEKRLKKEAKKAKKAAKKESGTSYTAAVSETANALKIFYSSNKSSNKEISYVNDITEEECLQFRQELAIQVYPEEDAAKYSPFTKFSTLLPIVSKDCSYVEEYINLKKFTIPSPIQAQCWPALFAGRDVIGIASTGSGKTLGFLIPGFLKLALATPSNPPQTQGAKSFSAGAKPKPSPRMLIMAPTRELAMQSFQVIVEVGGPKGVCIYGGVPKDAQKADLRAGADIVVATPGRLVDLIEENVLTLQNTIYVVLDEADRMLDEGFEPAIRRILSTCPPKAVGETTSLISQTHRQTVMFSATWPEEIRQLADTFMSSCSVRVTVGSDELSANHRVTQIVECIENSYPVKDKKLVELLEKYHKSRKNRILIFVLYKKEAVTVQRILQNKGYNVTSIHGDKSQNERFAALNEFKSGVTPLLIATDVAARGLDIPQVEYVVNYSFPLTVEDYVHRIGRTGRGGSTGISHTFFTDFDKALAGGLVGVLQEAGQEVPQEIYKYPMLTKKKQSKLYGDFGPKPELSGKKSTKITFDD